LSEKIISPRSHEGHEEFRDFLAPSAPRTPSSEICFFSFAALAFFARDNPNVWLRLGRAVSFVVSRISAPQRSSTELDRLFKPR